MVSLNASPTYNPESAKSRRLQRVARVNEQIREACDSMTISDYKAKGTGLGLVDLEKAIQEATVIKGVNLESACEMLRSSAAGKLGFDGIYQQAVLYGYRGVLKCLLTIPLTEWPMSYDAHLFLAMAYKSAHYNGDFWHARWIESDFHKHRRALYASGNVHLFKYLKESSLALSVGFLWKYFETVAWNDAVGTIEYLADHLGLTNVGKHYALLVKYDATKIISFLHSRNVPLQAAADPVGKVVAVNDKKTLEAKRPKTTEWDETDDQQAVKHQPATIDIGSQTIDTDIQQMQSAEQDRRTAERKIWNSLKSYNNRRIIERLIKCDTSLKEEYKNLKPQELDENIGIQVSRGTDKLCLLEVIKANVHLPTEPSKLLAYAFQFKLKNIVACIQGFPLRSFQNQVAAHAYMAVLYMTSECDGDIWMRFWLDSRFDLYADKLYAAGNVSLLADLYELPRNPDVTLPVLTAERFLEQGVQIAAEFDLLPVLQYFEQNHALDLNKAAEHLNTFVSYGAEKIIAYLVKSKHAKLDHEQVILAIAKDRANIVALAIGFGFKLDHGCIAVARMFGGEKCKVLFESLDIKNK